MKKTNGLPSPDLGEQPHDLPFTPLAVVLAQRARREQLAAGFIRPATGSPPGITAVCRGVGRRVHRNAETIHQWVVDARNEGWISFDRADLICHGLGMHPNSLWPDEWTAGWSEDLAFLEEVS